MTTNRPMSKGARTERRILEAARYLLAKHGRTGLSMRAVAERCGVTVGAIYRHYPDKASLEDAVVATAFQHLELRFLKAIAPLPVGSFQRVVALGEAYIAFAEQNTEEFKILFDPFRAEPRKVSDFPGQVYPMLRTCVADAMASGELRGSDPDLAAFYFWSRIHGIVMLMMACDFSEERGRPVAGLTPSALFDATREFVAFGMLPPDRWPDAARGGGPTSE